MAGRITPEFRERLLARVDIVDVVGLRVELKKAGSLFKSCCPFHTEKSPSFVVTPDRQTYHCFGCGAHGNAIDFLIEHDRLNYPEAVEELARQVGMELPASDQPSNQGPDLGPIFAVLERAASAYRKQLHAIGKAAGAAAYLQRRGVDDAVTERFGIGYAPRGWDFLLRSLANSGAARDHLTDAGLLVERDHRYYDRFRDRIMFPIHDRRGRVLGFGGRVIGDGEPKYLNTPETPVFHKGRELYGLYQVQQALRLPPRLLVVEGYMDVIALAQFGIPYAVATLGTATTMEHVKRLLRGAPELVFCFDGDRAGRDAAWKALQTTLPLATGRQPIRFLFLPDGADPDTLVRTEGREAFERRIGQAMLLSDYMFEHLTARSDMASAEGRAKLDNDARALIGTMPAGTFRGLLEERLAELVGFGHRSQDGRRPRSLGLRRGPIGGTRALTPLRLALALLLDQPALARHVVELPADWQTANNQGVALLREMIDIVRAYPDITAAALCERWRDHEYESAIRRLSDSRLIAHIPFEGRRAEFVDALGCLNREAQRERRWRRICAARRNSPGDPTTTSDGATGVSGGDFPDRAADTATIGRDEDRAVGDFDKSV